MDGFVTFLAEHRQIIMTLHLLGVALGLGGATITDMLFFRFLADFQVSEKEAEVMGTLSNIIMLALLLLFLTGAGLYLPAAETYNQSPGFVFKMIIVAVLTLNGLTLHWYVSPKLINISFYSSDPAHPAHRGLRKFAFMLGAISVTSWYGSFFIAMLKKLLPEWTGITHLLLIYVVVLAVAIATSQCVEVYLTRRSRRAGGSAL